VEPAAPGSGAALGSGAKVQSLATLLWGLTPECILPSSCRFYSPKRTFARRYSLFTTSWARPERNCFSEIKSILFLIKRHLSLW